MTSSSRLTARDGALVVVDLQGRLLAHLPDAPAVVANAVRLTKAAALLGMPHWATEQYPKGLGTSVPEVVALYPNRPEKASFHCCSVASLVEGLHGRRIGHVTLAGVEAHVCIAQTALELLNMGFGVQIPADAVASRRRIDWEFALRRIERAGAVVSTTEAVLFEWVETSDHPHFKAISALVKESHTAAAPL